MGCGDRARIVSPPPLPATGTAEDGGIDAAPSFPDTGIGTSDLSVVRVAPSHGPFVGGQTAVVRGTGLTEDTQVAIGGRQVQPADIVSIDSRRLQIVTPAGEPGPADVVVEKDGITITLADGYTYDPIWLQPARGPVAGGTRVRLTASGRLFADGDVVLIGAAECRDVEIVSETELTCLTPPMGIGTVDVTVTLTTDGSTIELEDVFTYFDGSDPINGGLGGGPLTGTLNVTVLNAISGTPVPDALVLLGDDVAGTHQGATDLSGQIAFTGEDVTGTQTLHVAKECFEKTTVVGFDAATVTIFLVPWMDPSCGDPGGGLPPVGRGRNGTFFSGDLIWLGPNEYGPNAWRNIPPPRANEVKVAYVYTTQSSLNIPNPDPGIGGANQRILEIPPDDGLPHLGYPYRIFGRPAGLAVYALAGLENTLTGEFIPYVMGVARNVLGGPGQEVRDVDIFMNIPLDHTLDVRLENLPPRARTGPDSFKVQAYLDLGGEGVIVRCAQFVGGVCQEELDVVRQDFTSTLFRFWAQPALFDALSDGRYRVIGGWYTGDFDAQPFTETILAGVSPSGPLTMNEFLAIPQATSPAYGERLPADRVLRWESTGGSVAPDFYLVQMVGGDGNPAWRHIVRGDVTEATIPDLTTFTGVDDISPGFITWIVYGIRIPGFRFDEFTYSDLQDGFWSHSAVDFFTATF